MASRQNLSTEPAAAVNSDSAPTERTLATVERRSLPARVLQEASLRQALLFRLRRLEESLDTAFPALTDLDAGAGLEVLDEESLWALLAQRIRGAEPQQVILAANGDWFQVASGSRVLLDTRPTLRRLVARLIDGHGIPVGVDALFAAMWPGENIRPYSAAARVYQAVYTLRKLGLRVHRGSDGYSFEDATVVDASG